jgi:hypothetical protein
MAGSASNLLSTKSTTSGDCGGEHNDGLEDVAIRKMAFKASAVELGSFGGVDSKFSTYR